MQNTKKNLRVAVITGSSGGVGSGIALRLAKEGFSIIVCFNSSDSSACLLCKKIIEEGGKAVSVKADISCIEGSEIIFQSAIKIFGRIDIVINNAGIIINKKIDSINFDDYHNLFNINVRGALNILKQSAIHLQDNGRIVNISSTIVDEPIAGSALYAASKAALESFSKVLSKEIGYRGITVNTIRLGPTVPGMFSNAPQERKNAMIASSPFKRLGTPEDVADVVAFITSEQAAWITGQIITVDGGAT